MLFRALVYTDITSLLNTVIPAPLNLMITSTTENSISLIWEKPFLLNEMIIYYEVSLYYDHVCGSYVE